MKMTKLVLITIILSSILLTTFNYSSAQFTCSTSGGGGGSGTPAPTPSCYYSYYTMIEYSYNGGIICEDTYSVREQYCYGVLVERQNRLVRHTCYEE